MRERNQVEKSLTDFRKLEQELSDAVELIEMGEAEGEEDVVLDGLSSLQKLADRADADKVQALLSGEADANDTYLEIHAGAGGTES